MQDNKSAMLLQKNHPCSTRKGMKHAHAEHCFAADEIKNKELKIVCCPTEEMIADHNSKPLQGSSFVDLRNKILGVRESDRSAHEKRCATVLKEHDLCDEAEEDLATLQIRECVGGPRLDVGLALEHRKVLQPCKQCHCYHQIQWMSPKQD